MECGHVLKGRAAASFSSFQKALKNFFRNADTINDEGKSGPTGRNDGTGRRSHLSAEDILIRPTGRRCGIT
jgi:hypothetical protein